MTIQTKTSRAATQTQKAQCCGYGSGHPWYYLLGGRVLYPKEIRAQVNAATYRGYLKDDILATAARQEPKRSEALRKIRHEVIAGLRRDIARYRQCAFELMNHTLEQDRTARLVSCDDVHVAISLKHNHIVNGFAHLALLNELPEQQGDLFTL
ncbi:MAG: hypothetical protein ACSHXI_16495 [Hoeflea sp.]|uniref:hypothetical protein n=1 Tax=Hoeflea sp. TaxID=1940281 RepID=UPI003EF6A91E